MASKTNLPNLGRAPNFTGITAWFNTPGNKPLTLSQLRGKVVLIDFWTYSCINCQRALPHVEGWYNDYKKDGLVVVGVSAPEFAFEHVVSNVVNAAGSLGIDYPVAVDDNLATWDAYNNEYWPAEYLIDPTGIVRAYDFGEGGYSSMENNIRMLLTANGVTDLPPRTDVPNKTPTNDAHAGELRGRRSPGQCGRDRRGAEQSDRVPPAVDHSRQQPCLRRHVDGAQRGGDGRQRRDTRSPVHCGRCLPRDERGRHRRGVVQRQIPEDGDGLRNPQALHAVLGERVAKRHAHADACHPACRPTTSRSGKHQRIAPLDSETASCGYEPLTTKEEVHAMTLEDKARNSAETVRGKAKGVVGRATGDKDLRDRRQGRAGGRSPQAGGRKGEGRGTQRRRRSEVAGAAAACDLGEPVLDLVVAAAPDGPVQHPDEEVAQVGGAANRRERVQRKAEEVPAQAGRSRSQSLLLSASATRSKAASPTAQKSVSTTAESRSSWASRFPRWKSQ